MVLNHKQTNTFNVNTIFHIHCIQGYGKKYIINYKARRSLVYFHLQTQTELKYYEGPGNLWRKHIRISEQHENVNKT